MSIWCTVNIFQEQNSSRNIDLWCKFLEFYLLAQMKKVNNFTRSSTQQTPRVLSEIFLIQIQMQILRNKKGIALSFYWLKFLTCLPLVRECDAHISPIPPTWSPFFLSSFSTNVWTTLMPVEDYIRNKSPSKIYLLKHTKPNKNTRNKSEKEGQKSEWHWS